MEKVLSRLMLVGITSIYMAKGALPTCFDQFCLGQYQNVALSLIFIFSAVAHAAKDKPIELKETKPPIPNRETIQDMLEALEKLTAELNTMKTSFGDLTRQVTSQQFFAEEKIRTDGSSGIKQTRISADGTKTYLKRPIGDGGVAGLHDHSNTERTVGLGQLEVVLNGVEFRTGHNDYTLQMPSTTTKDYNAVEDIEFPPVPPEVLSKGTVLEQIDEMREYFRAWVTQDFSVRDYRKYFKPVLSYLEGGWTTGISSQEPSSLFDDVDESRFMSYSGGDCNAENSSYLPTTIISMNNGTAQYAQWNYRIAAVPLNIDIPFSAFIQVDDLTERMKNNATMAQINNTRAARFALKHKLPTYKLPTYQDGSVHYSHTSYQEGLLDELMHQIPGKDNYLGESYTTEDGLPAYHIQPENPLRKLNTARYHRWYRVDVNDCMGSKNIHRGFSDPNLFVAQTTNPKISPMTRKVCVKTLNPETLQEEVNCTHTRAGLTYATPIEVTYMTPLQTWNPYDLEHKIEKPQASYVRSGGFDPDNAFNGTGVDTFYRTPVEFYASRNSPNHEQADAVNGVVGVLDRQGHVRKVTASGIRTFLPEIESVGKIRTRWQIFNMHFDGEETRKELDALKEMVMKMSTYSSLFEEPPLINVSSSAPPFGKQELTLLVPQSTQIPPALHTHTLKIKQSGLDIFANTNGQIWSNIFTSMENHHRHTVDVQMVNGKYVIVSCDGEPACRDGHDLHLIKID